MASNQVLADNVQAVASGKLSPSDGADQVAQNINNLSPSDFEPALYSLWTDIMTSATTAQTTQQALADFLVSLSQQPDPKDSSGNTIKLYNDQGWCDLPMFGWKINELWNSFDPAPSGDQRSKNITLFVNGVHFTALLIKTGQSVFQTFKLQILWTFRDLESPTSNNDDEAFKKLDVTIPAIAAVADVFGNGIGTWDVKYRVHPGGGSPARGGPLWTGEQGFNEQRYAFWKTRLQEISEQDNVDQQLRKEAAETVAKM